MRIVITRVLPLPAPARTSRGRARARRRRAASAFKPSMDVCRSVLECTPGRKEHRRARTIASMAHGQLHLDTLAIHAGQAPDPITGAVMPPIVLSSTFAQERAGQAQGLRVRAHRQPHAQARSRPASPRSRGRRTARVRVGLRGDDHAAAHAARRAITWWPATTSTAARSASSTR